MIQNFTDAKKFIQAVNKHEGMKSMDDWLKFTKSLEFSKYAHIIPAEPWVYYSKTNVLLRRKNGVMPQKIRVLIPSQPPSMDLKFFKNMPCEDCYFDNPKHKGSYGRHFSEDFGLCLKHYKLATWLDERAIITEIA
jgi:hypothetical protein